MDYTQQARIPSMFRCGIGGRNIFLYICIFLCFAQMLSLIFSHLQIVNTNQDIDLMGNAKELFFSYINTTFGNVRQIWGFVSKEFDYLIPVTLVLSQCIYLLQERIEETTLPEVFKLSHLNQNGCYTNRMCMNINKYIINYPAKIFPPRGFEIRKTLF